MERSPNKRSPEVRDKDDDRKHRRRLQDPLPLEKPHASDSKHDDRSNAGQDGTSTRRGGRSDHGWWRNQEDDRKGKHRISDEKHKDEKSIAQSQGEPSKTNADRPTKKKFREEKLPPAEKAVAEPVKTSQLENAPAGGGSDRREERATHRYPGRNERDRAYAGNRFLPNRARPERGGFPSRDRFRGRDGYVRRQGYGAGGGVEKWKHDMFDQVNRSPTSKNEEDPVAKAEALLAL